MVYLEELELLMNLNEPVQQHATHLSGHGAPLQVEYQIMYMNLP